MYYPVPAVQLHHSVGNRVTFLYRRDGRWCPSCVARSQISRGNAGLGALVFTQFSQHFSGAQSSGDTTRHPVEVESTAAEPNAADVTVNVKPRLHDDGQ